MHALYIAHHHTNTWRHTININCIAQRTLTHRPNRIAQRVYDVWTEYCRTIELLEQRAQLCDRTMAPAACFLCNRREHAIDLLINKWVQRQACAHQPSRAVLNRVEPIKKCLSTFCTTKYQQNKGSIKQAITTMMCESRLQNDKMIGMNEWSIEMRNERELSAISHTHALRSACWIEGRLNFVFALQSLVVSADYRVEPNQTCFCMKWLFEFLNHILAEWNPRKSAKLNMFIHVVRCNGHCALCAVQTGTVAGRFLITHSLLLFTSHFIISRVERNSVLTAYIPITANSERFHENELITQFHIWFLDHFVGGRLA